MIIGKLLSGPRPGNRAGRQKKGTGVRERKRKGGGEGRGEGERREEMKFYHVTYCIFFPHINSSNYLWGHSYRCIYGTIAR